METSKKFGFALPSRNSDDIADINKISDNFRIIEENIPSNDDLKNIKTNIDQTYNPESENAQSGIAVAEAVSYKADKIVNSASGSSILLTDSSNYAIEGLKVYGKSTQEGTPTPEAPIPIVSAGASGSVEVKVCGRNIFPNHPEIAHNAWFGITREQLADGGYHFYGTVKNSGWLEQPYAFFATIPTDGKYTLSVKSTATLTRGIMVAHLDGANNEKWVEGRLKTPYSVTKNCVKGDRVRVLLGVEAEEQMDVTLYIQLEVGETATDYEPYTEQTLTLATPNELRSVPVVKNQSAIANYIDASGQPWLCDYIDLEKGVKVENVAIHTLNGDSGWTQSGTPSGRYEARCNIGTTPPTTYGGYSDLLVHQRFAGAGATNFFSVGWSSVYVSFDGTYFGGIMPTLEDIKAFLNENPITVYTYRTEPIETPLTTEEIAYYKALHTNYPNTTIFNSDGTNMDVSYIADTKLYIDNKFAELQALALEG